MGFWILWIKEQRFAVSTDKGLCCQIDDVHKAATKKFCSSMTNGLIRDYDSLNTMSLPWELFTCRFLDMIHKCFKHRSIIGGIVTSDMTDLDSKLIKNT